MSELHITQKPVANDALYTIFIESPTGSARIQGIGATPTEAVEDITRLTHCLVNASLELQRQLLTGKQCPQIIRYGE
jgi:hypothetical protein